VVFTGPSGNGEALLVLAEVVRRYKLLPDNNHVPTLVSRPTPFDRAMEYALSLESWLLIMSMAKSKLARVQSLKN